MSLEDNLRALERAPILSEVGRDALRLLAFSAESTRISIGETLFSEGEDAECAYVVVTGRIELRSAAETRVVGPGALIGETALIVPTKRPCDAVSVDGTRVIVVPRATFRRMLEEYPQIAQLMHARLLDKVRAEHADLEQIRDNLDRLPGA